MVFDAEEGFDVCVSGGVDGNVVYKSLTVSSRVAPEVGWCLSC